jgi:hypothetical protein
LTEWGYEVEPNIRSLGRWAARSPVHDPTLPISATSIMLSFRTMFDADRARGLTARIGFSLGRETFAGKIANGCLDLARGDPAGADVIFTGTATALAAAVYGGHSLDTLAKAGSLSIDGDRAVAERFTTLFPLPPKVKKTR